mmetsp:Transcript_11401/g.23841  ORF Transcript_11401/g.23841 Transcript_11401/m.23841 type:complete len:216 (+) Transcript_11401:1408-2055(+)
MGEFLPLPAKSEATLLEDKIPPLDPGKSAPFPKPPNWFDPLNPYAFPGVVLFRGFPPRVECSCSWSNVAMFVTERDRREEPSRVLENTDLRWPKSDCSASDPMSSRRRSTRLCGRPRVVDMLRLVPSGLGRTRAVPSPMRPQSSDSRRPRIPSSWSGEDIVRSPNELLTGLGSSEDLNIGCVEKSEDVDIDSSKLGGAEPERTCGSCDRTDSSRL